MTGETSERLVFISHAGEDTWIAQQIAREVASRGARPFLDQADIDVGAEFEEDILRFLDRTNELIVLFTPWSLHTQVDARRVQPLITAAATGSAVVAGALARGCRQACGRSR